MNYDEDDDIDTSIVHPSNATFGINEVKDEDSWVAGIFIEVQDTENEDNDDIRSIDHPDFDKYWDNEMECVFKTYHFTSVQDARAWLLAIGMTEVPYTGQIGG